MPLKMDTSKTGLEMFFKPWQVQALDHLQQIHPRGANSRGVHRAVSRKNAISRTSIIIFIASVLQYPEIGLLLVGSTSILYATIKFFVWLWVYTGGKGKTTTVKSPESA